MEERRGQAYVNKKGIVEGERGEKKMIRRRIKGLGRRDLVG